MAVYAISDLHLPAGEDKPMDVFGAHWERHFERICADWRARVTDDDIVLMPGDITWAMRMEDAVPELKRIEALPGRKILTRGNHDYWWSSVSRVRSALGKNTYALQNDALALDAFCFAGTRGWILPGNDADESDVKIFNRELTRLSLSLSDARRKAPNARLICLLHYPPLTRAATDTGFTRLLAEYGVSDVVYGHLHGVSIAGGVQGTVDGICYHLVSCDALDFKLHTVL